MDSGSVCTRLYDIAPAFRWGLCQCSPRSVWLASLPLSCKKSCSSSSRSDVRAFQIEVGFQQPVRDLLGTRTTDASQVAFGGSRVAREDAGLFECGGQRHSLSREFRRLSQLAKGVGDATEQFHGRLTGGQQFVQVRQGKRKLPVARR